MSEDAVAYFRKAILGYNKGDISSLLASNVREAGPLLTATVNGIDIMGGMCFGFNEGSTKRSTRFMVEKMHLNADLAKLLYSSVRCGTEHQGMPIIGLKFFNRQKRGLAGKFIYKSSDGYLYLDVVEFAYSYLEAVDQIAQAPATCIQHHPNLRVGDQNSLAAAISVIPDDINDLIHSIQQADKAEEQGKFDRGEIENMSSDSAYSLDSTLNITITLPPTT